MPFQFKYYKDPGVIIDAIKTLSLKLNSKYFLTSATLLGKYNPRELDHIKKQLNSFETPPKELLLFFYKPTENFCNFMTRYVEKMLLQDFPQVTLSALYKKVEQPSALQQEIFAFYLPKTNMDETNLVSLLRTDTVLPDNIKFYLLSFQLDPQSFCSLLSIWIRKYVQLIEQTFLPAVTTALPIFVPANLPTAPPTNPPTRVPAGPNTVPIAAPMDAPCFCPNIPAIVATVLFFIIDNPSVNPISPLPIMLNIRTFSIARPAIFAIIPECVSFGSCAMMLRSAAICHAPAVAAFNPELAP